jgi:hypothetical protein
MALSRKSTVVLILTLALLVVLVILALRIPRLRTALRIVDGFEPLDGYELVYFEKGAEEYARKVAEVLPDAIERVETMQVRPFRTLPRIYVCSTHEGFTEQIGEAPETPVRGIAFKRDVWLSPLVFSFFGRDTHTQSLLHELSHTHISQHLSFLHRLRKIPTWFNEGLADWVAGTGAERVSREEGIAAIKAGRFMAPDDAGQLPLPKTPEDYGLTWPMFHVQSLMFVEYLALKDREVFDSFLGDVLDGNDFGPSFVEHFGAGPYIVWQEFAAGLE